MAMPALPAPLINDAAVFLLLAGHFQGVDDAGQNYDGGSVLIIVEYRNVSACFFKRSSISKHLRCGDVLQVDAAEG